MPDTVPSPRMPERCLNCDTVVELEFCPSCGQHRGDYRKSTGRLVKDVFAETFEVDGRLGRTLRAMLRPGRLTREFNKGRRKRYMSPVRLYLFVSLVLFAASGLGVRFGIDADDIPGEGTTRIMSGVDLDTTFGDRPLGRAVKRRIRHLETLEQGEFVKEIITSAVEHAPLVMFVLLPVYALILKALFVGTRWLYVDHLVFALHIHTFWYFGFLFLLGVTSWLPPDGTLSDGVESVILFVTLGYTVLALRHAYSAGWGATLLRAVMLASAYTTALSLGVSVAVLAGFFFG